MRISGCVPLAGQGVIARYGGLVAVTDGSGPGPDPMLSALAEAAAAAGDGSDLVLRAARAALGAWPHGAWPHGAWPHGAWPHGAWPHGAWPQGAWACAGVMAEGGVAVLVHGRAVATIQVEDGPGVTLIASESMLPVSRTFTGATVVVGLALAPSEPVALDPRYWLGEGVLPGGGLAVTMSADQAEDPFDWHEPTMDTPVVGTSAALATPAETSLDILAAVSWGAGNPQAVPVDGVLCGGGHFNDPAAWCCRQCGIGLDQPPRDVRRGPRPPLGVLELDDGTRFTLDGDYVLGREPTLDGDVLAGRARPLRINDPNGTVSRLHLKISLAGWQVEVSDLGSANGSALQSPGEERTLAPFEPMIIEPGARIGIGHRSMQYLAYQGVLP